MASLDSATSVNQFLARLAHPNKGARTNATSQDEAEEGTATAQLSTTDSGLENDVAVFVAGTQVPVSNEDQASTFASVVDKSNVKFQELLNTANLSPKYETIKQAERTNMLEHDLPVSPMTPTQIELLKKSGRSPPTYMDDVLAKFKARVDAKHQVDGPAASMVKLVSDTRTQDVKKVADTQFEWPTIRESTTLQEDSTVMDDKTYTDSVTTPRPEETLDPGRTSGYYKPVVTASSPLTSPSRIVAFKSSSFKSVVPSENNVIEQATDVLANNIADLKVKITEETSSCADDRTALDGENREGATYFTSWGTPDTRRKPASRIRKVVLSGLPPHADYTLIQSLIHGGAIESININQSNRTAYVLFTEGDSCDTYYNRYPNGLVVKIKGKSYTIFVDKGKEVDIISGKLEGYLSAGASRVLRAVNVDEEWSMRALHRIAEGDKGQRKIESISDTLRNEVRTIFFRFANIMDAIVFRQTLHRDPDWENVDVQFMPDPCGKATDVHFD